MNLTEIIRYLPHRYPFLLVDRVLHLEEGKQIKALKNVTVNEPFFSGHFPDYAIMPGVLVVEALAQAAAILAFRTAQQQSLGRSLYYFVGIDRARFRHPVLPGDQLELDAKLLCCKHGFWKFCTEARVSGKRVAGADLTCTMREIPSGGQR